MPVRNSIYSFGSVSRFFHWTIFLLVYALLIVGFVMYDLKPQAKGFIYNIHKLFGLLVLILMVMRLIWKWMNPSPHYPITMPTWQRAAARLTQWALYLSLLAMPIAGWVMATAADRPPHFYGLALPMPWVQIGKPLAKQASTVHYYLAWTIIFLIGIHILGTLKHLLIDRDNVVVKMMPGYKQHGF